MTVQRYAAALAAVVIAITLFVPPRAAAQALEYVELPAAWRAGERIRMEVERQREDRRGGTLASSTAAVGAAEVEVLAVLPDGYLMRWRWSPIRAVTTPGARPTPQETLAVEISRLVANVPVDIRTDRVGTPREVVNLDEVVAVNRSAVDTIGQALRAQGASEGQVTQVLGATAALMTPEIVAASVMKEPHLFMLAAGGSYPRSGRITYQDVLPSPFGGESLPSVAYYELSEQQPAAGAVAVLWGQTIDQERAHGWLESALQQLAALAGVDAPTGASLSDLSVFIEDGAIFVMDTNSGWPRAALWGRTITIATATSQQERLERIHFRVAAP